MIFSKGDLLIVMTDLTPDCNLLGKPAFVESDEPILHNQRIGKVELKDKNVHAQWLFYVLLSRTYLDRIKEQATGSPVRHTSNKSIYTIQLAWPPLPEQRAITEALSDVDALLRELDRLIVKKHDVKQAVMQQLLSGQARLPGFHDQWEVKRLGDVFAIWAGKSKSAFVCDEGDFWICDMGSVSADGRLIVSKRTNLSQDFLCTGDLIMPKDDIGGAKSSGRSDTSTPMTLIFSETTFTACGHAKAIRAFLPMSSIHTRSTMNCARRSLVRHSSGLDAEAL